MIFKTAWNLRNHFKFTCKRDTLRLTKTEVIASQEENSKTLDESAWGLVTEEGELIDGIE